MKIGDYVRTKYGITQYREYKIDNCGLISELVCMPVKNGDNGIFANVEDIIKSSPNIIDLIEVGDYVNGYPVEEIYLPPNEEVGKIIRFDVGNAYGWDFEPEKIYAEDIKSIVTKEQFKSMEYRIGDK